MSSPKNFKEIFQSLPKNRSKYAIVAPLPPQPPTKVLTQQQVERQKQQFKEMMELVNSERCPLCKAQLDGPVSFNSADVYCCANGEVEYTARYVYGLKVPQYNISTIYCTFFAYEIHHKFISENNYQNIMYKIDLNSSNTHSKRSREKILDYEGMKLFLDKNLSEERILKKIKLYQVFQ